MPLLLIAAILTDQDLALSHQGGCSPWVSTVLVEVHDAAELQRVLALGGFPLIGINNRDLSQHSKPIWPPPRRSGESIPLSDWHLEHHDAFGERVGPVPRAPISIGFKPLEHRLFWWEKP